MPRVQPKMLRHELIQKRKNDGIKLLGFLTGFGTAFGSTIGIVGGINNFSALFVPFGWLAMAAVAAMLITAVVFQKIFFRVYINYFHPDLSSTALLADTTRKTGEWVAARAHEAKISTSSAYKMYIPPPLHQSGSHPPFLWGNSYDRPWKFVVMGDSDVGKTCLLLRYVDNAYTATKNYSSNFEYRTKTIDYFDKTVELHVYDTPSFSQQQYPLQGARGAVITYDITDIESFNKAKAQIAAIKQEYGDTRALILVGTKYDQTERRQVESETARDFAAKVGIPFIETSAKNGIGVNKAFEMLTSEVAKKAWPPGNRPIPVGDDPFSRANADTLEYKKMMGIATEQLRHNYLLNVEDRITFFGTISRKDAERDGDLRSFGTICETVTSSEDFIGRVCTLRDEVSQRHRQNGGLAAIAGVTHSDFARCLDNCLEAMFKKAPADGHFAFAYRDRFGGVPATSEVEKTIFVGVPAVSEAEVEDTRSLLERT